MLELHPYIPKESHDYINSIIDKKLEIKLSRNRKSKWGDFRAGGKNTTPTITINKSLNPRAFLLTLIHEIAHYHCWKKFGRKVKPHGKEWKEIFTKLTYPVLTSTLFEKEYRTAILKHLTKPKSSICYDIELMKFIEPNKDQRKVYLSQIKPESDFYLNHKKFKLLKVNRTRALCREEISKKRYFIHLSTLVETV